MGKPQWYGTQYKRDPVTNQPGERFPFDEKAISDEERSKMLASPYQY